MLSFKMKEETYKRQRRCLDELATEFGLVVFRPHGHREKNNLTLIYIKRDMKHNIENSGNPNYVPKPPIWQFENTDANGKFSYDWGNKGTINLRGLYFKYAIRDAFLDHIDALNASK